MKLFRGIKRSEVRLFTPEMQGRVWASWKKILARRVAGDFSYPTEMNAEILELEKLQRLTYQHFTDDEQTATEYARREGGVVMKIEVPMTDVREYFMVEFQNFGKRKKKFELVYIVKGKDLDKMVKKWELRVK